MEEYKKRARDEAYELEKRKNQLEDFIRGEEFMKMNEYDQDLVHRQLIAMTKYLGILRERIKRFDIRQDTWQLIGSRYFFDGIEGFTPHDSDYILLEDDPKDYIFSSHLRGNGECRIKWKWLTADEFLKYSLNNGIPMQVGKFLVPEFNKKIGFTIKNLRELKPVFENLDKKHKYEKIIFDSYIKNNGFILTEEQRMKAYEEYKKERENL